jgi:hypothetical protein
VNERAGGEPPNLHPGIDAHEPPPDNGAMDRNRMFVLGTWIPAAFCFLLAAMQLVYSLSATGISSAFLFFLPMCFVYAGISNLALHRRLVALEARLPPSTPSQPS